MIWQRLKNLWELSKYEHSFYSKEGEVELKIKPSIFKVKKKKKQRLATIVQDPPLAIFEEEKEDDTSNK